MTVEIKIYGEPDEIAALAKGLQEPQQSNLSDLPNYIPASEAGSARTAS